jgi:iron complex outermembrane receptor protein
LKELKMKKKILLTPIALVASMLVSGVYAQDKELSPVTVTGSQDGYIVNSTSSATRTDTPIEQIPQTIVVVPKKLIEDQGSTTLADAVKSVSNIQENDQRDISTATSFKIRGFNAGVTVDGVAVPGFFANQEPVININQVDVIKGPTGSLYGGSQSTGYDNVGGSIAITSKAPEKTAHNEAGFTVGSYNHRAAFADINQPINDQLGIRLVTQVQDADSETNRVTSKQTFIAPSISLRPNKDSGLTLRLRHVETEYLDSVGLDSPTRPRDGILTAEGMPKSNIKSDTANLQWTQKLNDVSGWGFTLAETKTNYDSYGIFFGSAARQVQEMKSTAFSPYVTAKFKTQDMQHRVIAGYEYDKTKDSGSIIANGSQVLSALGFPPFIPPNPYYIRYTPTYLAWDLGGTTLPSDPYNKINSETNSVYVQDQIDYGRFHFQVGLKHAKVNLHDIYDAARDPLAMAAAHNTNTIVNKTLPRIGVVYDLTNSIGLFSGYGEGMRVPTSGSYREPIKPSMSKQAEVGFKLKNWNGLYGTFAWYDLTRTNVPATCDDVYTCQVGKQNSKGVDLDLRWVVTKELTGLFGYSNQDAKTIEDTQTPANVGKSIKGVPDVTYRLGAQYDIRAGELAGFGVGGGLRYHSKLPVDASNSAYTESVTVYDANISYRVKDVKLGLVVNNLLDKKYFVPSSVGNYYPGLRRTVMLTSSLSF